MPGSAELAEARFWTLFTRNLHLMDMLGWVTYKDRRYLSENINKRLRQIPESTHPVSELLSCQQLDSCVDREIRNNCCLLSGN
jgi:hypothetical protein